MLLKNLTYKDIQVFITLREDFTSLINTFISNMPTTEVSKVLKTYLIENLSKKYLINIQIFNTTHKIILNTELYTKDMSYGINVFPYIESDILKMDKDFYAFKKDEQDIYCFSSVYELKSILNKS